MKRNRDLWKEHYCDFKGYECDGPMEKIIAKFDFTTPEAIAFEKGWKALQAALEDATCEYLFLDAPETADLG